jgi:hypothetical protein
MVNQKKEVNFLRAIRSFAFVTVLAIGTSGCGGNSSYVDSISDESWAGMTVCAKVFARRRCK